MRHPLRLHPDSPCDAVAAVEVEVERPWAGLLVLHYQLTGDLSRLVVPPPARPARTDGLWKHTCFEAFLRGPDGDRYAEFNFAPSGQWAAYAFDRYREGMQPVDFSAIPAIECETTATGLELRAGVEVSGLPDLRPAGRWRLGLSAVIEEVGGRTSYWALAHPPGRADFHHPDGFALTLPGPSAS